MVGHMRVVTMLLSTMTAVSATTVVYSPPVRGPVIRHFDAPADPYAPGHRGIDLSVPVGTVVTAAASGLVAFAGSVAGSLFVSIDHDDGLRSTYSFLSAVLVRSGQVVQRGDAVARSGTGHPGSVDPSHVHFGIRRGSVYLDPEPIIVASLRRDYSTVVRLSTPQSAPQSARSAPQSARGPGDGRVAWLPLPVAALAAVSRCRARAVGGGASRPISHQRRLAHPSGLGHPRPPRRRLRPANRSSSPSGGRCALGRHGACDASCRGH